MHIHPNSRGGWSVDAVGNYPTRSDAERVARLNDHLDLRLARVDGGPPPWMPVAGLLLVITSILALAAVIYSL